MDKALLSQTCYLVRAGFKGLAYKGVAGYYHAVTGVKPSTILTEERDGSVHPKLLWSIVHTGISVRADEK